MSNYPDGMDWRAFDRRYGPEDLRYEAELETARRAATSVYAKLKTLKVEAEGAASMLNGCEDASNEVDAAIDGWQCLLIELGHALDEARRLVGCDSQDEVTARLKMLQEMAKETGDV